MTEPSKQRFPRTEREAFQSKHNTVLAPRYSKFHGQFAEPKLHRFWKTLQSLILGN